MADDGTSGPARPPSGKRVLLFVILATGLLVFIVAVWALIDRPGQGITAIPGITEGSQEQTVIGGPAPPPGNGSE